MILRTLSTKILRRCNSSLRSKHKDDDHTGNGEATGTMVGGIPFKSAPIATSSGISHILRKWVGIGAPFFFGSSHSFGGLAAALGLSQLECFFHYGISTPFL